MTVIRGLVVSVEQFIVVVHCWLLFAACLNTLLGCIQLGGYSYGFDFW